MSEEVTGEATRQELEDMCMNTEECKAEADTEGYRPCIGCDDFAVASNDTTAEETAPTDMAPGKAAEAEFERQADIHEKIAERLQLLDKAKDEEATLKDDHKDAKACVETHKKALENLCRSLVTPPEATLWNHPDVEVTFDPVAEADDLETGHPHVAAADAGLGSAIWTCDSCGHKEAQADLRIEDEGRSYECSNCTSINTMMCEAPPDDTNIPEGDGESEGL